MKRLLRCSSCSAYTMKEHCDLCGRKTLSPRPPKYSPEDKYSRYRRISKSEERKKVGLI